MKRKFEHVWRYLTDPVYNWWINEKDFEDEMKQKEQMMRDIQRMDLMKKMYPEIYGK